VDETTEDEEEIKPEIPKKRELKSIVKVPNADEIKVFLDQW
jgi:hypothetical protein